MSDKKLNDYNMRAVERAVQILSFLDDVYPVHGSVKIQEALARSSRLKGFKLSTKKGG